MIPSSGFRFSGRRLTAERETARTSADRQRWRRGAAIEKVPQIDDGDPSLGSCSALLGGEPTYEQPST